MVEIEISNEKTVKCRDCAKTIAEGGLRWWVCGACDQECPSMLHAARVGARQVALEDKGESV
jgi:hypothetical protein